MDAAPRVRKSADSRPGILKVFWPAFLGWGSMVVCLVSAKLQGPSAHRADSFLGMLEIATCVLALTAPVVAVCVTALQREARSIAALLINATTFLLYAIWLLPPPW